MGWIAEHLNQGTQKQGGATANAETTFVRQAQRRWGKLAEELRADVDEFNSHDGNAVFTQHGDEQFSVSNSSSGLELVITADFAAHTVRYEFRPVNDNTAGTPEGGILSMRESRRGFVEFYSADERLTSEETRQVLLEPVLFPPQRAA